jgi:hypothetical protein
MRYGIVDAINEASRDLLNSNGGKPLTETEIIEATLKVGLKHGQGWSRSSIMPYDFCHNHENQGSRPQKYGIFNLIGPGLYECVGRKVYSVG